MKEYPEWTVEACLCSVGHIREDCPYTLTQRVDYSFSAKVDSESEGTNYMLE